LAGESGKIFTIDKIIAEKKQKPVIGDMHTL